MMHLGLTGFPVAHSLSPKLIGAALRAAGLPGEYGLYPLDPSTPEELGQLLQRIRTGELSGLNVTIPHKQAVIAWLDELSATARATGSVNLIASQNGKLTGHNTDSAGFLTDLNIFLAANARSPRRKNALVLGAGGSARSVAYALVNAGWQVRLAARRVEQARALIDSLKSNRSGFLRAVALDAGAIRPIIAELDLVVNSTPAGMSPWTVSSAWPPGLPLPEAAALYDLVYSPPETLLVKQARAAGLVATTGLGMLVEQARLGFQVWTGHSVPREILFAAVEEL